MKNICVYCGSSPGKRPEYIESARQLARELVARDLGLVYGGARVGIMAEIANAVLAEGGEVIGVIPQSLVDKEVAHHGLTKLHTVDSMHDRKALMADLSDGFIALPGGLGTLEELFETLTCSTWLSYQTVWPAQYLWLLRWAVCLLGPCRTRAIRETHPSSDVAYRG